MSRPETSLLQRASEFVQACPAIDTAEELGQALADTVGPFGFPAVSSGRLEPSGVLATLHFATWPPGWIELYMERDFIKVDPVPLWAANSGAPIVAGLLRAQTPRSHPAQEVFRTADAFGFGGGLIAPQRAANNHPGVVAFVGPRDPEGEITRFVLCGLASVVFHRAEAIFARGAKATLPEVRPLLTARERECLRYFVEGRTAAYVAKAMCVSQATVRFHSRNLCDKTGAANRAQLAAFAIARGLLDSDGPQSKD